ncbi:DUF4416 family protein [Novipirellula rosea]|uniref:DUF4416 family protein n=1 Tax=Novipirellula rosea TaxID=1031540 RepID=A0ABP8NFS4_9BACT
MIQYVEPVVRFCAVITRHDAVRAWAVRRLNETWGETFVQTPQMPFEAGGYYTREMGGGLEKTIVGFRDFADPAGLADWKTQTNLWELECAQAIATDEPRPLNLDPGYVTQAKLVLATTKDRDHRIYLRDGMFAEVTLTYVHRQWVDHRWTYPDYRTDDVKQFAQQCREHLREHLKSIRKFRNRPSSKQAPSSKQGN